jgi:hypothetical protein
MLSGPTSPAQTQLLSAHPLSQSLSGNEPAVVRVRYAVSGDDPALTGLGLRLHWDSSRLALTGLTEVLSPARVALDAGCYDDHTTNFDGDPATDCYALIGWASLAGDWPGGALPQTLLQAQFESLMAEGTQTSVNLSSSSTAAGYGFNASAAMITQGGQGQLPYATLPAPCRILDTRRYGAESLPVGAGVAREVFGADIAGQGGDADCATDLAAATALVVTLSAVSPTFPQKFPPMGYGTLLNGAEMSSGWTFDGTTAGGYQEYRYDTPPYNRAATVVWDQDTRLISVQAVVAAQAAAPRAVLYSAGDAHYTLDVTGYFGD